MRIEWARPSPAKAKISIVESTAPAASEAEAAHVTPFCVTYGGRRDVGGPILITIYSV